MLRDGIAWLLSEGLNDENLAEMTGKDQAGRYIVTGLTGAMPDPTVAGPAYEDFRRKYAEEYGRKPSIYCSNSYDAAALVILSTELGGGGFGNCHHGQHKVCRKPARNGGNGYR